MLNDNEYQEVEGRQYVNPQASLDETNAFIDNFRNTQQQNTAQISADTQALGTDVPTVQGGLTGAKNYWTSRYQTPQYNSLVNDLRATAQAKALNDALSNEEAIWKKRYQDAYRAYQKREYDKANTSTSTSNNGDGAPENITTEDQTVEIGEANTEGISQHMYEQRFYKYIDAGYPVDEAKKRASNDVLNGVNIYTPIGTYNGGS